MTFHCRACGSDQTQSIVHLGSTPLANSLVAAENLGSREPTYPLELVFCRACTLVQITQTIPPDELFGTYVYYSSFSDTAIRNAREIATRLTAERKLGPTSLVIEAASNDGYLLQHYKELKVPILGIEPARNIAAHAEARGIKTRCAFFGTALADELSADGISCDVFHANNVLAHVPDLNGFAQAIQRILKRDGIASIEVPYLRDLVDHLEFDTIYHEHLSYFSVTALASLFAKHGLAVVDVERIPIHGGSLRVFVAHDGQPAKPSVSRLLAEEVTGGLTEASYYSAFAKRIEDLGEELRSLLKRLKGSGSRIAAYGASAKGSTLLNTFGIGRETLDFVADRSTVKQGKFTPGTLIPIVSPQILLDQMPDYVLLLTWNFADEIIEQQSEYRQRGGKFIVPLPRVRIL